MSVAHNYTTKPGINICDSFAFAFQDVINKFTPILKVAVLSHERKGHMFSMILIVVFE